MASGFRTHDPTQKTNVRRNCIKKSFAKNVQSVEVLHLTILYPVLIEKCLKKA